MENEFDGLFDDFFGDEEKIKKLIDRLNNFNELGSHEMKKRSDKPDKIEKFEKNGIKYIRSTWFVDGGKIVRVDTVDDIEDAEIVDSFSIKSLEQLLNEAIENEEYEKAAEIRNKINKKKG